MKQSQPNQLAAAASAASATSAQPCIHRAFAFGLGQEQKRVMPVDRPHTFSLFFFFFLWDRGACHVSYFLAGCDVADTAHLVWHMTWTCPSSLYSSSGFHFCH